LAISRVFKADDLALHEDFKESIRLCDLTSSALKIHARDTCSLYALAMSYDIKAYDLEFLFDLEEGLLERDKAIEALKRIGLDAHVISERLNKSRVYADLGDEKAGLKELDDFDRAKSNYNFSAFYKQEIFATTVRSMLLIRKAMRQQALGEPDSAKLTFQITLDSLNQAVKQLNDNKKMLDTNEFKAAQYMIQSTITAVYGAGRFPNQGDSILAHAALAEAWGQRRSFQDNNSRAVGFILKKDFENAKKSLQTVLHDLVDPQTDTANIFSTPSVNVRNVPYLQLLPQVYYTKNRLLTALYDDSKARNKADLNYLKHGFTCAQNAISSVDSLRMNFSTDATMQNVVKAYSHLYAPTILTAGKLYQETNDAAYLDTMLRISEQYKTFILRQTVYTRTNRERYTGETRRLYEQEAQLKRDLIGTQNAFFTAPTPETLQKRDAAHSNYRQFKENLRKMPPNTEGSRYYAERFADSIPTVKDIQRDWLKTEKGEAPRVFLSFTFSPTHIIALLITPDKAQPYIRETTPQLWALLKRFNESIEFQKTFPNAAAYQLYETLLKDVLLDVPQNAHLIISAEGLLLRLPFEALLTQFIDDKAKNYAEMPFLIQKHRVSYLPSLTTQMWLKTFHQSVKPMGQKIGIVKGHYLLPENDISMLLNTADSVAAFYKKSAVVFDNIKLPFVGNKEEESDLTELFFAVHGEASAANPLDYALILKDSCTKKEDPDGGRLTVAKIQRMKFKQLNTVVFGSCETQHGELDLGEGMFSIARAFQGLGARHIVCTLNSVPVEPTARTLNNFFYQYKGRNKSLSKALHEAKLGYLKTTRREECHPHFWANIVYLGDD
jgi:CHAT domain-containing protein